MGNAERGSRSVGSGGGGLCLPVLSVGFCF